MEARERNVLSYKTISGTFPFRDWRSALTDEDTKAAIDARIARLRGGNFGSSEPIGEGVSENKIDFGPGFRIYYGTDGDSIVLLCGGDKSTQNADIRNAKAYWKDYRKRNRERKALKREGAKDKK